MTYYYEFGNEAFEYNPDIKELREVIKAIILTESGVKEGYNKCEKILNFIVDDLDLVNELEEQLHDQIKGYFEDDAREEYTDSVAFEKELKDWFGTKNEVIGL